MLCQGKANGQSDATSRDCYLPEVKTVPEISISDDVIPCLGSASPFSPSSTRAIADRRAVRPTSEQTVESRTQHPSQEPTSNLVR